MKRKRLHRGRRPSIRVAAARTGQLRRHLKALVTETRRLEQRLLVLDRFYRALPTGQNSARAPSQSRRGPNVRDLAYEILALARNPLPLQELATRVARKRRGRVGARFAQNLGIASTRDPRFRRVDRGTYGIRKPRQT